MTRPFRYPRSMWFRATYPVPGNPGAVRFLDTFARRPETAARRLFRLADRDRHDVTHVAVSVRTDDEPATFALVGNFTREPGAARR